MERLSQKEFWQRLSDLGTEILQGVWQRGVRLLAKPMGRAFGLVKRPIAAVFGLVRKPLGRLFAALKKPAVRGCKGLKKLVDGAFEKAGLAARWWIDRGWPAGLLYVGGSVLLLIPVNVVVYLWQALWHEVGVKPSFLAAWLLFSGTIEAWTIWLVWRRDGHLRSFFADKETTERENKKGVDDGNYGGAA